MKLLTEAAANAKTAKNSSHGAYLSYILHLAPYNLSGHNVCPAASAGCAAACLNSAGRGAFSNVQAARVRKTLLLFKSRAEFVGQLGQDLNAVVCKSVKLKLKPVVRLNGTSDLDWTRIKLLDGRTVFEAYPDIQFYDYTKVLRRLYDLKRRPISNYHLTFSRSETNEADCIEALRLGYNVAVVFAGDTPLTYLGAPTIDGDSHDLRFLDPRGAVVALKAKGKARRDTSGFVINLTACASKQGA